MVEGGGEVHTQFLTEGLADELQLVVAPIFVGHPEATRFVGAGRFPFSGTAPGAAGREPADRRRGAAAVRTLRAVPGVGVVTRRSAPG